MFVDGYRNLSFTHVTYLFSTLIHETIWWASCSSDAFTNLLSTNLVSTNPDYFLQTWMSTIFTFKIRRFRIRKTVWWTRYRISRSAHRTPNSEFQFPQFKVLQSGLYWHFWVYFDINLKLLSGKNTQKVNKQNIWDS